MTTHHKKSFPRIFNAFSAFILVASMALPVMQASDTSAAQITTRSLTLRDGATAGGSLPGGLVNHEFDFDLTTGSNVGSIKFEYCTTAAAVPNGIDCNTPVGLVTTGTNIGNQGPNVAGFVNVTNSTNGTVIISRAAAANLVDDGDGNATASFRLDGITNPVDATNDPTGMTFFVRISTHAALDATDAEIDTGTVAAATNYAIELDGTMPESLVFCAGADILVNAGLVPDCATATAGTISFDRLFSPTDTAIAESKMAASTNAGFGYSIAVHGTTLESGSNSIAAMSDGSGGPTTSIQGTPQFGLNLVENLTTADVPFGSELTQSGGILYTGAPAADYGTAESFKYADGDAVAASTGGSDAQIYTVAYMANVPGSQPAGTYATTLTYICTPTF